MSSFGKGIDDVGNELECLESNNGQDYILAQYNYKVSNFTFGDLAKYLDRKYSFLGLSFLKNALS